MKAAKIFKELMEPLGLAYEMVVPPEQILGYRDTPPEWFGIVNEGFLQAFELDPDSLSERIFMGHFPGDLIFAEALSPIQTTYPQGLVTTTEVRIRAVRASEVQERMNTNLRFAAGVGKMLATAVAEAHARTPLYGWTVTRRVAWALRKLTNEGKRPLEISQQALAKTLGTQRETVTHNLKALRVAGIVTYYARSSTIEVVDPEALDRVMRTGVIPDPGKEASKGSAAD